MVARREGEQTRDQMRWAACLRQLDQRQLRIEVTERDPHQRIVEALQRIHAEAKHVVDHPLAEKTFLHIDAGAESYLTVGEVEVEAAYRALRVDARERLRDRRATV